MKTIAFVAGKSGGHILPCLHLIPHYTNAHPSKIIFFSTKLTLDAAIIVADKRVTHHVSLGLSALPNAAWKIPFFIYQLLTSWIISISTFIHQRPTVIVTTGGIVAIPVACAALLLRIPIHLYILDVKPGKALKFLLPFAHTVFYCFKTTRAYIPKKHAQQTFYPSKYTTQDIQQSPEVARAILGLQTHKKTITILGGSQGSLFINNAIVEWVKHRGIRPDLQIIHQTGNYDNRQWHTIYPQHQIAACVFDFRTNLANIYAAADVIVCRAGAGTLFEALAFGKKCIIIPLETSHNKHQVDNAYALQEEYPSQCIVIRQATISNDPEDFFALLDTHLGYSVNSQSSTLSQSTYQITP